MAKISSQARQRYNDKIKQYQNEIEKLGEEEIRKLEETKKAPEMASYLKLDLAELNLNIVSYYLLMNSVHHSLLGVRSIDFLNFAKRYCYKSLIYLEETVSHYIDVPYSEIEERINEIADYEEEKRLALIHKLGFAIQSLIEGYGKNSKWQWSFVEIEGRFSAITKNLIDMKALFAGLDPRSPGYEDRIRHLDLTKTLLAKSAKDYRYMFETSTNRIEDFKKAINFLNALRRIHILLGETNESIELKKKVEIWSKKMEDEFRKQETGR